MSKKLGAATRGDLAPVATRSATFTGAALETRDYEGDFLITQSSGIASAADTLDGKIQESDDGATGWTDVAGGAFTQVTDAAALTEDIVLKIAHLKPFIRYVGTIAGTTVSIPFGVRYAGYKKAY